MGRNQVQNHHNLASHGLSGHFPPPAYKIKAAFHREIWSADEVVPDLGPPALPRIGGRGWTLLNFDPSRVAPPLKDEEEEEEEEGKKSKGVLFCQSVNWLDGRIAIHKLQATDALAKIVVIHPINFSFPDTSGALLKLFKIVCTHLR